MALVPYDPFRSLSNMKKEFDRLFSDFPYVFDGDSGFGGVRVDVYETDNEVVATCDLPGLEKKDDVQIEINNDRLQISGTIERSAEVKEENMYRSERHYGRFQRIIALPCEVSEEGAKATYKNGVLEIRMPKAQKETKKKIDIDFF